MLFHTFNHARHIPGNGNGGDSLWVFRSGVCLLGRWDCIELYRPSHFALPPLILGSVGLYAPSTRYRPVAHEVTQNVRIMRATPEICQLPVHLNRRCSMLASPLKLWGPCPSNKLCRARPSQFFPSDSSPDFADCLGSHTKYCREFGCSLWNFVIAKHSYVTHLRLFEFHAWTNHARQVGGCLRWVCSVRHKLTRCIRLLVIAVERVHSMLRIERVILGEKIRPGVLGDPCEARHVVFVFGVINNI